MPEDKSETKKDETVTDEAQKPEEKPDVPPVETQHTLEINGKKLDYTATTGMMPLKNAETGEKEADIFFTAYTLNPLDVDRPLAFVFNGGPGSASVWLHLGALGPKRVKMQEEGWLPKPPYKLVDNEFTWLDQVDLVFIDPVGTGYSRATKSEHNKKFWGLKGDLEAVGEFIRLYLTRYQRWSSPLFLAGESYGTTRAAGLAGHLINKGIAFNGIMLISTILNFQTARFTRGNDLPYPLFLPSYSATAWYHKRLGETMQKKPLAKFIAEVEKWAQSDYVLALMRGDDLSEEARAEVAEKLAAYTGLSLDYIKGTDLRINIMRFCKELLRDQNRSVGRLDSRFKGIDDLAITEFPDFDPLLAHTAAPYTATINDYVRRELGYETDTVYETLSYAVNQSWEWDQGSFPDTSEALRSAMAKNPFMKVYIGQGYYDLGTPHLAAWYTLDHMGIDPELRDNLQREIYEAGHMYYLDLKALAQFREHITTFINGALAE